MLVMIVMVMFMSQITIIRNGNDDSMIMMIVL